MKQVGPKIEHKTCFKCDYEGDTSADLCPRCGKTLKSSRNLRVRGGILIACGGFLIVFMAALAVFIGYLITRGDMAGTRSRFTGTRNDLILIFGALAFVAFFGLLSLANGFWQLVYGRRNQFLVWLMMGAVFALIIVGTAVSFFLG